jgi:hypothetical protein
MSEFQNYSGKYEPQHRIVIIYDGPLYENQLTARLVVMDIAFKDDPEMMRREIKKLPDMLVEKLEKDGHL